MIVTIAGPESGRNVGIAGGTEDFAEGNNNNLIMKGKTVP